MNKYDEMFRKEQEKIEIKKELKQNEKQLKNKIVIDFCNQGLFDFLEYLNNKFYVRKHGVNHHIDRNVYTRDIVYSFERNSVINSVTNGLFRTGIQYKWQNGDFYDTLKVECIDFKPILTYEGKRMNTEEFIEIAISQIQNEINNNSLGFQIIEK
jgi:hypothetical protein